eukprot:GHVU01123306.1.p2 GENE.GHVU01123306.1~~GHVU01123306.1.p2  ORF type:complete len:257 (+),score=73.06 GHVU01123306.1:1286-2056(+)
MIVNDYRRCRWPMPRGLVAQNVDTTVCEAVALAVDEVNETWHSEYAEEVDSKPPQDGSSSSSEEEGEEATKTTVISFSHFLPRVELIPEKRFLFYQHLAQCSGSVHLRSRVEALRPNVHVFGHTHFGWDQEVDGVRYVQAALSYPYERRLRFPSLEVGSLRTEPLLLFDSSAATEAEQLPVYHARWSDYYAHRVRTPTDSTLAEWVLEAYWTLNNNNKEDGGVRSSRETRGSKVAEKLQQQQSSSSSSSQQQQQQQ